MDEDELAELELVLSFGTRDLADFLSERRRPPPVLTRNSVFRLIAQYGRYWTGAGHEPGGEYR